MNAYNHTKTICTLQGAFHPSIVYIYGGGGGGVLHTVTYYYV